MKNRASFYSTLFTCICLMFSVCGFADTLTIQKSIQGISYITGGISEDEVASMRAYLQQFNLRVVFSEGISGRSITYVNVNIYDKVNKLMFSVEGAQPQLLVNLPAGKYKILADYNGDKQSHPFSISATEHKKIILNWKNSVDEDTREESGAE